jgi:hypothetical protein
MIRSKPYEEMIVRLQTGNLGVPIKGYLARRRALRYF